MVDIVIEYTRDYVVGGNTYYTGFTCFGGGAANVAYYASLLGASTGLLGSIGDDAMGKAILEHLSSAGIVFLGQRVNDSTGVVVVLEHGHERSFLVLPGANSRLKPDYVENTLRSCRARVVFVHGYGIGGGQEEAIATAVRVANEEGAIVVFDPGAYNIVKENLGFIKERILPHVHVLVPNEAEAKSLTGSHSLEETIRELKRAPWKTVLKLGAKGSVVIEDNTTSTIEPYRPKRVVSTTGAGDSFDAAIVYGLTRGYSLVKAAQIGNRLAAHVVECMCPQCPDAVHKATSRV